jgi:hypothetical protein
MTEATRGALADTFVRTVVTSAVASIATGAALMVLGERQGRGALRPIDASSHWLYGDKEASGADVPIDRTAVGLATNYFATMFWSFLMEKWLGPRKRTLPEMALAGGSTAALAAVIDYVFMPRRLSPGWELALTRKSMAGAFAAMAAGLTAGALDARCGATATASRKRNG